MSQSDWLTETDYLMIREFVQGMMAGAKMAGKTRHEIFDDDFWMYWDDNIEVHVWFCKHEDGWCVEAYKGHNRQGECERIHFQEGWV